MYPTSTTEVPQNDVPPVVKGMKMAVTAMNGMSGRKKIVAAEGEKRHHNEHRGDAGGDEQQRLIFEGAAGRDGLNGGLAHDVQGHAEEEHRQSEAHHETRVIDGQRLEKEPTIVEIEAHVATQHKQEGDFRKGNERACRAAPREGDLVQHEAVDAESDGDGERSVNDDGG